MQTTITATPLEKPSNDLIKLSPRLLESSPALHRLKRDLPSLSDLLDKVVRSNSDTSLDAPTAAVLTRNATTVASIIANVQTIVDNVFVLLNSTVISVIANLTTIATEVQQNFVSPALTLVTALANLTIIQAITQVYTVLLTVGAVLSIANITLTTVESFSGISTTLITTVQSVVDSIFALILTYVS